MRWLRWGFAISLCCALFWTMSARANTDKQRYATAAERKVYLDSLGDAREALGSVQVYRQIIVHVLPKGFTPFFEMQQGGTYLFEYDLAGKSQFEWKELLSLNGFAGGSSIPVPLSDFARQYFGPGTLQGCTGHNFFEDLGMLPIDGALEARLFTFGCSRAAGGSPTQPAKDYSEQTVGLFIRGDHDLYLARHSVRGAVYTEQRELISTDARAAIIERLGRTRLCSLEGTEPDCKAFATSNKMLKQR